MRVLLLLPALLLAACAPAPSEEEEATNFLARRAALESELAPCARDSRLPFASLVAQSRCLEFSVAENPAAPEGRRIPLKVMRIPSFSARPAADPLVVLVGGPGQAATEAGVALAAVLSEVRQEREILLVDQRGTGALSPFDCDFEEEENLFETSMPWILERQAALLDACLASVDADPAFYTTDLAVRDLEEIRRYFGYAAFNLWGGSYGTRVALAYMQAYPQSTRSVVLDGVAPPALRLPLNLARDASASLEKVLDLCAAQAPCAATFPALEERLRALLARLETPLRVQLEAPAGEETTTIDMTRALFVPLLRAVLYSREYIRLLPLLIEQAARGDFDALAAITPAESDINQGMFLSVICSEDMSGVEPEDIEAALGGSHLLASDLLVTPMVEACARWPTRALDSAYFEPVASERPVLILSGALDPVTPPPWGERVAQTLPNSRHLVVEGVAHIVTPYGCAPELVSRFIAQADAAALDADCLAVLGPRPFFLSPGGSAKTDD